MVHICDFVITQIRMCACMHASGQVISGDYSKLINEWPQLMSQIVSNAPL